LKIISNQTAKRIFIKYFFKDTPREDFTSLARNFALQKISSNLNQQIFNFFSEHLKANHTVCIVSASCADWIQPWCNQYGAKFIGTELEINNGKITGNFTTKNCYGPEKVNRIQTYFDLADFEQIRVYGSGKGDREMLMLSK
jgi:HAD superfamily phosphoserine phosphatase-like hydrolase